MRQIESEVLHEIGSELPRQPVSVLSRQERHTLVGRACHSLYRWYLSRSQVKRNWNPDQSFDWPGIRKDHSPALLSVLAGFYAVEQYIPDFTSKLTQLVRRSYGRSQFQLRWGAEEEKHADLWRNVLLFSGAWTPDQLDQYTHDLRASAWELCWDSPLHMMIYAFIQERATQVIYLNTARIARGEGTNPAFAADRDPVLAQVALTIATDEAAHFDFFLGMTRLHLYYFPEETLGALVDVLRHFVMPASEIIPNYDGFITELYRAEIFGPAKYGREVAKPALAALGITTLKEIEAGIRRSRQAPQPDGSSLSPLGIEGCAFPVVETAVEALFTRIGRYEDEVGLSRISKTVFVPAPWSSGSRPPADPSTNDPARKP
jgi:acyl-[acyl-carrier-protein] desaturase